MGSGAPGRAEAILQDPVESEPEHGYGDELLRLEGISKSFPGVRALNQVHLTVRKGEVHALLGENGAGKSTLMKILSGAYLRDEGEILWDGQPVEIRSPKAAQDLGIGMIYQEFNLVPQLSIAENIWMGREIYANRALRWIDWPETYRRTQALLDELHLALDPRRPVEGLGVAHQQMIEIARALSLNARLLVMDEPTSALTDTEIQQLFSMIRGLKERGISVIFISHHLDEVLEICDRGTVLRDGEFICTVDLKSTTEADLIQWMVGRTLEQQYPKMVFSRGSEALRVTGLSRAGVLHDIHFSAYTGEVLGIAGLVGSGRTELMHAIFGVDPLDQGEITVFGKPLERRHTPEAAIRAGIGLLPEDRKQEGLVLLLSLQQNISMASLNRLTGATGLLQLREEQAQTEEYIQKLHIAAPGGFQLAQYLSGGNQQKVVLAKWLASQSKILIFDEPTRGIDVGAKVEVYHLMNTLVEQGAAVIMVSSEMPELLGMSDRILVMREGRFAAEFSRAEATQEKILAAAMGVSSDGANTGNQ